MISTLRVYVFIFKVKVGFILNIICVVVVTVAVNTWGIPYYKLDEFPDWAEKFLKTSIEISTGLPDNGTTNIYTTMWRFKD